MLDVVSKLIFGMPEGGDEMAADPERGRAPSLEIFQSTALLKMPRVGREKPWHQDHAYFDVPRIPSASGAPTNVVGIWLALDEATVENGCMHVLAGQHRAPVLHFQRRDWQVCDKEILGNASTLYPIPLKPGSLMMFSSLLTYCFPSRAY